MSEFKQVEPLPVEIGDELYFDYGNGTAEDGYVHLTSARRAHESTLDYAAAMRLHSTMSRALGLPDVAELQRRVEKLEAQLEERKEAVDAVAAALQDALTQRNAAVSIIARDIIETASESLMDAVDAAAPALRALVDAARERMEKAND